MFIHSKLLSLYIIHLGIFSIHLCPLIIQSNYHSWIDICHNHLGGHKLVNTILASFSSKPALLDTAEGRSRITEYA
jgi:hypothetical protein